VDHDRWELAAGAIRREMLLGVDREEAWSALRDAEGLSGWLADEVDLEVREGADGRVAWRTGEERLVAVEEVTERRRLVLCWREPDGEPSLVELTLDDAPEGTRLVVVEIPLPALRVLARGLECGGDVASGPRMLAAVA
jgi:uncharacterized protein YndB with AHSA1/START domain